MVREYNIVFGRGFKQQHHYNTRGGNMHMELQRETRQNIVSTTGLSISELLKKKPTEDVRLKLLQRKKNLGQEDFLVRGNPQLTLGSVTPIEKVDEYFDKKQRKAGGRSGSWDGISK